MFRVEHLDLDAMHLVPSFRDRSEPTIFYVQMPAAGSEYPVAPLPSELEEAGAKVNRKDADELLWRRTVLRALLAAWTDKPAQAIELERNLHGKPRFGKLVFNASWAYDAGLIAISNSGPAIGVDLEAHRRIGRVLGNISRMEALIEVARRFYLPNENAWLESYGLPGSRGWMEAFFLLWCRKEALVKAWGESIGSHSMECDLSGIHPDGAEYCWNNQNWTVYDVAVSGHFASLCIGAD